MLSTGQRAMTAAALANMTHGGERGNQYGGSQRLNSALAKSNKGVAKTLSVSPATVKVAKEIKRDAPDLAEKVSRGEMSDHRENSTDGTSNNDAAKTLSVSPRTARTNSA